MNRYFEWRQVSPADYAAYRMPRWLRERLPADRAAVVVDFGCGYGQALKALRDLGYGNAVGIDVNAAALAHCREAGLDVVDGNAPEALAPLEGRARLVLASHVLEHFPRPEIVGQVRRLKALLEPEGELVVAVPNAQAPTGAYWAYEDFTHETLFTSGSLYFVLRAAGFDAVEFLDVDALADSHGATRWLRRALLAAYRANYRFWNRVTGAATHAPSPDIFSYEIKAAARMTRRDA